MAIEIPCPSCRSKVLAPDSLAGKTWRCRKCGATIIIPGTDSAVLAPPWNTGVGVEAATVQIESPRSLAERIAVNCGQALPDAAVLPAEGSSPGTPDETRLTTRGKCLIAGGAIVALLAAGLSLYFLVFRDRWERQNRPTLLALKSDAEKFAGARRLAESKAKYDELFRLLGDRHMRDTTLEADMNSARQSAAKVDAELIAREQQEKEARLRLAQEQARRAAAPQKGPKHKRKKKPGDRNPANPSARPSQAPQGAGNRTQ